MRFVLLPLQSGVKSVLVSIPAQVVERDGAVALDVELGKGLVQTCLVEEDLLGQRGGDELGLPGYAIPFSDEHMLRTE